ncbi:methionyl-tRNA formyltransferase [Fictibacillus nanhaiensis]|uniref:Methionyl-tRNA formyltransferase n=1 Tax=Fictibacillus nanhaiensis TaxID=742169 RepID=A0ABS2ZPA9_9BACL|nr:methionyl-tRNA formyltransferase [Fictibacillus nanhaiensis]
MKYVLFIGSRVGFEALNLLVIENCDIHHVFIEKEHEHEYEKYYQRSIEKCKGLSINYSVNSIQSEIIDNLTQSLNDGHSINYIMSFGYRRIIPGSVVKMANIAAFGTHFSPLPRYRGFAPLNWVLINGETETAVNIFYLDKEVDNGDIVDKENVPISYDDDINTLFEKCIVTFRKVMRRIIPKLEKGKFDALIQDNEKATYTCARNPEDGLIKWEWNSTKIYNLTRALTYPFPGAFSFIDGRKIFIWSCEEYETPKYEGRIAGKVVKVVKEIGVVVLCGEGAVLIKDVQLENGERQTADNLIKSIRVTLG